MQDKWRVLNRRGAKKLQAALNKAKHDLKMVRILELGHWQHA